VAGLSSEERERLALVRPASIVSSDLSMRLIAVTSAAGRGKTNGRNDTEGSRRIAAARKENICGAVGTCRFDGQPGLRKCWVKAKGECLALERSTVHKTLPADY